MFTKAMQMMLDQGSFRKSARSSPAALAQLKLAVESYVLDALYERIINALSALYAVQVRL